MAKFCLGLHYNADKSYVFDNGKLVIKIKNFPSQFCLGSMSYKSDCFDTEKYLLNLRNFKHSQIFND